jgi:2-polyprenyl-3-methyl-5-hydroxy-6-metoxy-1,4-benzoquinol methylase
MEIIAKQYSKTLDEQDYNNFHEMDYVEHMKKCLPRTFYPCHRHCNWEYGLCINALQENQTMRVLEVGGAGSIFAAYAAWLGMEVTVVDPSSAGARLFAEQNMILQLVHRPITFKQLDFFQYQDQKKFDAVVCISTLEHVSDDVDFFKRLLCLVKEGGLLLMTVDFHPSGQRLVDGHLRTYNQERLAAFIAIAENNGFEIFGDNPDYTWKGENVSNYTVASLALKRKKRQEVPVVLFVNKSIPQRCGVYQFGKRIGNILSGSEKCRFIYTEIESEEEYWKEVDAYQPNGAIFNVHLSMPWLNPSVVNKSHEKGIFQVSLFHEGATPEGFDYYIVTYPNFPENAFIFSTPRPLMEYENTYPIPEIPVINCFGFGDNQNFLQLAQRVNQEFDVAILNLQISYKDFDTSLTDTDACRRAITKKGIELNINHAFLSENELLDFLAKGSLNAFLYYERKERGCASTLDFALAVKRPIAITKSNMMLHVSDAKPSICIEDRSLKEIMASGFGPLEPYYEKWRPKRLIEAYEKIVEKII